MKKLTGITLTILVITLAAGTFIEKMRGADFASQHIYASPLFLVLWGLLALALIIMSAKARLWKRPCMACLHAAILFILLGGLLTMTTGQHGEILLQPDIPCSSFFDDGPKPTFSITLKKFEVLSYPGTQSPMDYSSEVRIVDSRNGKRLEYTISMNKILKYKHYRFYQSDYDDKGNSILSVSYDPWGINATYFGYILLSLGLIGMLLERKGAFRSLLNSLGKKGACVILLVFLGQQTHANPRTLPQESASKMGEINVLYKGRICPLQTLAKEFTTKLYGSSRYKGMSSEQVLCGWVFYPNDWSKEPMIKVKDKETRQILGIDGKYARLDDFHTSDGNSKLAESLNGLPLNDPSLKKVQTANEKLQLISMLCSGQLLKIFPHCDSSLLVTWYAANDQLPLGLSDGEYLFIRKLISYAKELLETKGYESLDELFEEVRAYQSANSGNTLPSSLQHRTERLYNKLSAGKWLPLLSVTIGLVLFACSLYCIGKHRHPSKCISTLTLIWTVSLTLFLATLFTLHWIAGKHIPLSGSYDTMLFMAMSIGCITLVARRRNDLIMPSGAFMMGIVLLVVMMIGANPTVTKLMPVLASPLLGTHVSVIMLAYALFFFVAFNSTVALVFMGLHRQPLQVRQMSALSLVLLFPATVLLSFGIIIGAIWANVSWGNYWSWDPKEIWALITLIVYAVPLHFRLVKAFQKPVILHLYCVIAFLFVLFTYFGVNYFLSGLHAYN